MKNLMNLEGVKALSKMEQKSINGGRGDCNGVHHCETDGAPCPRGFICAYSVCGSECVPEEDTGGPPIL